MSQAEVQVRPYRPEDEPLLFGLASLDRGADERTLDVLERETVFVAEVQGSTAGYVALAGEQDRVRVDQLFVSPEHEAQGVGTRLLEHAEGFAIYEHAKALQVVVARDDRRALQFYRERGFVPVAEDVLELVLPEP